MLPQCAIRVQMTTASPNHNGLSSRHIVLRQRFPYSSQGCALHKAPCYTEYKLDLFNLLQTDLLEWTEPVMVEAVALL